MSVSDEDEVEYEVEEVALSPDITLLVTTVAYMPITTLLRNQGRGVEISGQKVWCGSLGVVEVWPIADASVPSSL